MVKPPELVNVCGKPWTPNNVVGVSVTETLATPADEAAVKASELVYWNWYAPFGNTPVMVGWAMALWLNKVRAAARPATDAKDFIWGNNGCCFFMGCLAVS